jgi:4-amino-4-deoxy-L-arabinose transferase-like glycosyltransferase
MKQRRSLIEKRKRFIGMAFSILNSQFTILLFVVATALALRLLVWHWHKQYQLGGDEQDYFDQALTLLRTHRYVELKLMRPPLYTGFLAACIYLFDSLIQRLRLIQAIISALTIVPVYLLTRQLFGERRIALLAALLAALNYTLAANATELLTETLFVFGLTIFFWLLLVTVQGPILRRRLRLRLRSWPALSAVKGSGQATEAEASAIPASLYQHSARALAHCSAVLAGLTLGALILLRSVALPLLPLGALWLFQNRDPKTKNQHTNANVDAHRGTVLSSWFLVLCFVLATVLIVAPWTTRNYLAYGALILVDTTGAENLWLDNNPADSTPTDPLGREAAKRELYALGDDRGARQRLATQNAVAAIARHPGWFAQKAWGEATKFFALQYFDDMRNRRAIWVPPLEVWLRLLLGDGMWLALLLGGAAGLWRAGDRRQEKGDRRRERDNQARRSSSFIVHRSSFHDPRWLFIPWALYTLFTAMLFHVELRYRLPLYPVLLPYAAKMIVNCKLHIVSSGRTKLTIYNLQFAILGALLTVLLLIGMTLLHRPYIGESWMLARKHIELWQADRALDRGDAASAAAAAGAALGLDGDSALARVAQARAALAQGERAGAIAALDDAIGVLKAHPYAHLLRGAILREQGDRAGAAAEFAYERNSLEDLQRWSWHAFGPFAPVPNTLDIGTGDLGFVQGFWLPEDGMRWTRAEAQAQLTAPPAGGARLELQLNAGRPAGAPPPPVSILVNGRMIARLAPSNEWREYSVDLPTALIPPDRRLIVTVHSDTFRPHDYDRTNPDDRDLGVMVRSIEVVAP